MLAWGTSGIRVACDRTMIEETAICSPPVDHSWGLGLPPGPKADGVLWLQESPRQAGEECLIIQKKIHGYKGSGRRRQGVIFWPPAHQRHRDWLYGTSISLDLLVMFHVYSPWPSSHVEGHTSCVGLGVVPQALSHSHQVSRQGSEAIAHRLLYVEDRKR